MKYHVEFDIDFKRNPYKGFYVAIEGIDGAGKTVQVAALQRYFEKKGKVVVVTSEPRSDSLVGKIIRQVLQSKIKIPPPAFQYLYSADRVMNQEEVVKPSLEKGAVVLSHRSFWSVIPYGVMDKGLSQYDEKNAQLLAVTQGFLSMYHQFIKPDIIFYLDISVDVAMSRLSNMDKEKEMYEKKDKLTQILRGYQWQLQEFENEFVVVDGERNQDEVTMEIITKIENFTR